MTTKFAANLASEQQTSRHIPAREIPVPDTVSPQMRALIGRPLPPRDAPRSIAEWKTFIAVHDAPTTATLPALRKSFGVSVQPDTIAGVKVFIVTPESIPEANRDRLLLHFHGGAFLYNGGEAATAEAILTAAYCKMKVISVDYRMPPDHSYPAAVDDATAVWKELSKTNDSRKVAFIGSSAGGNLVLVTILRAKKEGLPLPAALAPGTPWSDVTKTGDSFYTNEMVDNLLVTYDGLLEGAAKMYANGRDLKDPMISPIYGDLSGFPPAILTTGTRDLFLSNTVRLHRKLRAAGVEASLQVFEGVSHGQYGADPSSPETTEYFKEVVGFFDKHLAK